MTRSPLRLLQSKAVAVGATGWQWRAAQILLHVNDLDNALEYLAGLQAKGLTYLPSNLLDRIQIEQAVTIDYGPPMCGQRLYTVYLPDTPDGRIEVARCIVNLDSPQPATLSGLQVKPLWRRHGVGRTLVQQVLADQSGTGVTGFVESFGEKPLPLSRLRAFYRSLNARLQHGHCVWPAGCTV